MLSENAKIVLNYVKENEANDITSADIAEATGLSKKTVDGVVTSAFQKKDLMERIPGEITLPDGTHKAVKIIKLTDLGRSFDPEAQAE